jgi:hypothetical protein
MVNVAIIKRDNKVVAKIRVTNGVEILKWFHNNVPSCSMDWAIKHEGYSYDMVFVSLCDDIGDNKGGYFCQVYDDEDMENEINYFVIHKEDLENCLLEKREKYIIDFVLENV